MQVEKNRYFAYRSFWPELATMKKFREEVGCDTFNVMISNTANSLGFPYTKYPPVWKWNDVYDLDAFDRQLDDIINVIPDAKLMCMLDLNTPHWWTRYLGAFGVRYDSYYDLGKISAAKIWREDTAEYMRVVMNHAQRKYGDRIVAYMLGCGGATEWHDRSRSEESVYKLNAYRKWQAENGRTPTDIPGRMRRDAGSYDFCSDFRDQNSYYNGNDPTGGVYTELFPNGYGLFRSPEKDQDVLDYLRFCNEFNADTVSFFLSKARETIPENVELGCFFGYAFSVWMITAGHLEYERLLKDKNLDFVSAPIINYKIGDGGASATARDTVHLHGKQMLHEMDQKIYCYNRKLSDCCELPDPNKLKTVAWNDDDAGRNMSKNFTFGTGNGWINEESVAAGLKRDGAMALIKGDSLWWFDMWGGFYQGEKVYDTLRRIKAIWDRETAYSPKSAAEILMVIDPENLYLLNDLNERCGTFIYSGIRVLGRCGMPYDVCSFNDLNVMDTARYKFVMLCTSFHLTEKKLSLLNRKVLNGGRTVFWMYGPVINEVGQWDEANVEKVCGIPFAAPGIVRKEMGGWQSVYTHRVESLEAEDVAPLIAESGCHVYCGKPRPVYANERLVAVHTGIAETLTIGFPRKYAEVTELFSGRKYRDTASVQIGTTGPDTFLFRCEDL